MADDIVTRCPECNEFGMRYMGRVANDGDGPWVKCHHLITPDEWAPPPPEGPHDHKGHSEERCVRCGWVMGMTALNCQNNDTPHRFPSQEAEIERLRAEIERLRAALAIAAGMISTMPQYEHQHPESVLDMLLEEARRG